MSKTLATAAEIIGAAALIATGVGAIAGAAAASTTATLASVSVAATASTVTTIATVAAAALEVGAALTAKKPTQVANPMEWQSDPQAGLPIIWARAYSAGKIFYRNSWGGSDLPNETICTCYSIGPIKGFETYYVDGVATTGFGTSGSTPDQANIPDLGYMFVDTQIGAQPGETQCGSAGPPGWGDTSKTSGLAVSNIRLRYDTKGNNTMTSEPRCGFVVNGVRVYDPRQDSTYPGGSGGQRWDDETTWGYGGYDNPHLFGLSWLIGWRQNGKLVVGVGVPIDAVLVDQFVEGANICDANGWKGGGILDTTEDKWTRLKDILATGGAEPLRLGAQIGCLTNTPRVSLATIGVGDVIGEGSVQSTQSMRDRINAVVPRYTAEQFSTTANSDGTLRTTVTWGMTAAAPVVVGDYVTVDGKQRQKQIDFEFVQGVKTGDNAPEQVAQLARYAIEDAREFGPITLPLKLRWMGYRPGDVVTADLPELGLVNQDILLLQRKLSPANGSVTMTARSETAAKHPFALGQTTVAPATPSVSGFPLVPTPNETAWTITGETIEANGTTIPALTIDGASDSSTIDGILFEYRVAVDGQQAADGWQTWTLAAPNCTTTCITGLADATYYEVGVSYRKGSATGDRLILGPVAAGHTTVPWTTGVGGAGKPANNATNSADLDSAFGPDDTIGGAKDKIDSTQELIVQLTAASDIVAEGLKALAQTDDPTKVVAGAEALIARSRQSLVAQLSDQLLAYDRKEAADRAAHLDGVPLGARLRTEITERQDGQEAIEQSVTELSASTSTGLATAVADLLVEQTTRAMSDAAEASTRSSQVAQLTTSLATTDASIATETTVRSTADAAETAARQADVSLVKDSIASAEADIVAEATTRASVDAAETGARTLADSTLSTGLATTNAGLATEQTTRAANDAAETTARTAADSTLTTGVTTVSANLATEQTTRASADAAETTARTSAGSVLQENIDAVSSNLATEQTTRAANDNAETASRTAALSTVEGEVASVNAALTNEATTRATNDTAETAARAAAVSLVQGNIDAVSAGLSTEATTRATNDTAETNARTSALSTVQGNVDAVSAANVTEATTRSTNDTALSTSLTAVSASVGSLSGSVTALQEVTAQLGNKVKARFGIVADVGGGQAGIIGEVENDDGTISSSLALVADHTGVFVKAPDGAYHQVAAFTAEGLQVFGNIGSTGSVDIFNLDRSTMTADQTSSYSGDYSALSADPANRSSHVDYVPGIGGDMAVNEGTFEVTYSGGVIGSSNPGGVNAYASIDIFDTSYNLLESLRLPYSQTGAAGQDLYNLQGYSRRLRNSHGALTVRWRLAVRYYNGAADGNSDANVVVRSPQVDFYWSAL